MSSKTAKISVKKKYEEYEKVMHLVYLYLEKNNLSKDFANYCAIAQGRKVYIPSKIELLKQYIKELWKKLA